MILDSAWAPTTNLPVFATAGRDKQVKIWARDQDAAGFTHKATIAEEGPITAIDVLDAVVGKQIFLAIGTETGRFKVYRLDGEQNFSAQEVRLTPSM